MGESVLESVGDGMNKIDSAISIVGYILDCLKCYKNIVESGCCNSCEKLKECEYRPEWGQLSRFNCPFYKGPGVTE